jgi:hypothetical protein
MFLGVARMRFRAVFAGVLAFLVALGVLAWAMRPDSAVLRAVSKSRALQPDDSQHSDDGEAAFSDANEKDVHKKNPF